MNKKILVKSRSDDYIAYIADEPATWECGNTVNEALGKLAMTIVSLQGWSVSWSNAEDSWHNTREKS